MFEWQEKLRWEGERSLRKTLQKVPFAKNNWKEWEGRKREKKRTKLIKGPRIHQFSQDAKRTSIQQVLYRKKHTKPQNEEIFNLNCSPPLFCKVVLVETDNYRAQSIIHEIKTGTEKKIQFQAFLWHFLKYNWLFAFCLFLKKIKTGSQP